MFEAFKIFLMKLKEVLILAQKIRQKSTTINTFKFMTKKKIVTLQNQ